jgi:guanylate kinase
MIRSSQYRSGIFFCLVGPAGSGKSSLGAELLGKFPDSLTLSVSTTSRQARPNEVDGVHYDFVSRAEFEQLIAQDHFFEWEETHGNLYGTSKEVVARTLEGEHDLLLDIDVRGALHFFELYPKNCVNVLLLPPDGAALRERLLNRSGTSQKDIEVRFETALREYGQYLECFKQHVNPLSYLLINEDFKASFDLLCAIYQSACTSSALVKSDFLHSVLCVDDLNRLRQSHVDDGV